MAGAIGWPAGLVELEAATRQVQLHLNAAARKLRAT